MFLNSYKYAGFTLIELMVTVAVLAILMTLAVPSFQAMVASNISATQANELVVALNKARIEAIKKHRSVVMCASENQIICNSGNGAVIAADKNNWEKGWIIQLLSEENSSCTAATCTYIQQKISSAGSNTIKSINFINFATGRIVFDRMGNVSNPGGTFVVCDYRGATEARAVIVSITGYTKVNEIKTGGALADVVNDNVGADVTCP
ncbi:MAG: GspH/FimT family pseudopilin [Pseudomonadota bacterium]